MQILHGSLKDFSTESVERSYGEHERLSADCRFNLLHIEALVDRRNLRGLDTIPKRESGKLYGPLQRRASIVITITSNNVTCTLTTFSRNSAFSSRTIRTSKNTASVTRIGDHARSCCSSSANSIKTRLGEKDFHQTSSWYHRWQAINSRHRESPSHYRESKGVSTHSNIAGEYSSN